MTKFQKRFAKSEDFLMNIASCLAKPVKADNN